MCGVLNSNEKTIIDSWTTKLSYIEKDNCTFDLDQNHERQCLVSAATDDYELYNHYSELLLDSEKAKLDDCIKREKTIFRENELDRCFLHFLSLLDDLYFIKKCSWLLPQMIKIEEICRQYLLDKKIENERVLVRIYDSVITCAKNALNETDLQEEKRIKFKKIAEYYEKLINQIQDVDFSFKSDDE